MHLILSGAISAPFHVDGSHLAYFRSAQRVIASKLCEELVLHDQMVVPCPDFLTALGLIEIVGENAFIELLEAQRLKFVRTQGNLVYMRGNGPDGALLTMTDPTGRKANSADIFTAIELAFREEGGAIRNQAKLKALLEKAASNEDACPLVSAAAGDAYRDFRESKHWRRFYTDDDPQRLRLLCVPKTSGRVLGKNASASNPADILLSMAQNNMEMLLALKYSCDSISTASPLGGSIDLKVSRLTKNKVDQDQLWRLYEINQLPDVSQQLVADKNEFLKFIRVTSDRTAQDFRHWFHQTTSSDTPDIAKEYISVLKSVPRVSSTPMKGLRFAVTTALGAIPIVGTIAGALDTFVVEKLLKGSSPRYFIENLEAFRGRFKK